MKLPQPVANAEGALPWELRTDPLNLNQVMLAEGSVQNDDFAYRPIIGRFFFETMPEYRAKLKETADNTRMPKPGSKQ